MVACSVTMNFNWAPPVSYSNNATIKGRVGRGSALWQIRPGVCDLMLRVLSTHLFLNQRLHPGLLELAARAGAQAVEIFAARQHFDYTSRDHVMELAGWFRSN